MKNSHTTTAQKEKAGFTLIELLVVIAIIGLLSSVVLASLSGARESARDARRASDFNQLRTAIELYFTDTGEYPGAGYNDGQISENCSSNQLYQDLVGGGYLASMPTDPSENFVNCTNSAAAGTEEFFYGFDHANQGGDACIVINNFETSDDGGDLSELNEADEPDSEDYDDYGGQANTRQAEFIYCFEDAQFF